jgi:hypothetical protein
MKGGVILMHQQKQYRSAPNKKFVRRKDDHVLHNVVSIRISDLEKRELERITVTQAKSVSEVVREAIESWLAQQRRLCLDS